MLFSSDGAATWTVRNHGLPAPPVNSVAVDAGTAKTVYASAIRSYPGIFASSDSGQSWREVTPLDDFLLQKTVTLAADPSRVGILYAGSGICDTEISRFCYGGIYRTTDAGESWALLPGVSGAVLAVLVDPHDSAVLYASVGLSRDAAGGIQGVALKSRDGGSTWSILAELPPSPLSSFAVDPTDSSRVYATGEIGIWVSRDAGASWTASNTGLDNLYVGALAIDSMSPNVLYVATSSGVFRSADYGQRWEPSSLTRGTYALAAEPAKDGSVFAATLSGVYHSSDAGRTWRTMNPGLSNLRVRALAIEPSGRSLHAGTDSGVFDIALARRRTHALPPR